MSEAPRHRGQGRGPFNADQVRPGDPYEISQGHPVLCMPTGGRGSGAEAAGALALGSDPDVEQAGIDAGYSPRPDTLRAPDIAIGNVPDEPGWIRGAPPLAVEYADRGQDEDELQEKIRDLLEAGTRLIWVVRLVGPRHVEVYEKDQPTRFAVHGEELSAPGILRNPVPVAALYDRETARDVALRNLLQRYGYDGVDAVREEGREEGREIGRDEGRAEAQQRSLLDVIAARGFTPAPEMAARIAECRDQETLSRWIRGAAVATRLEDVFQPSSG